MRIPNNFNLFTQTWSIRGAGPGELGEDLGQCRPDQLEIIISPHQTPESVVHTLVHELTHAVEQKLQLNLEERQVDLLALGLIDLFRSNPNLLSLFDRDIQGADDDTPTQ